jgi:hypothetical protein
MSNKGFDEYGNYGENNPPLGDTSDYKETVMASTWHYQLMYHKVDMKSFVDGGYYAIHEYYPDRDGDGWTEVPVDVTGDTIEEVKEVLQNMLEDIEKHGVIDYE